MKAPFSYIPALPAVIGWIVGILLWWIGTPAWLVIIIATVGIALMVARYHYLAFAGICIGAGWLIAYLNEPSPLPEGATDGEVRWWAGEVINTRIGTDSQSLLVRIDSVKIENKFTPISSFRIAVATYAGNKPPLIGNLIQFPATIEPLKIGKDYPGQADMSTYYLQQKSVGSAFVNCDSIHTTGRTIGLNTWFVDRRENIISLLAHSGLDDDAFGVLSALIVGYDDELNPEIEENFRAAGIAHALALSGFHVGVIVIFISIILAPLRFYPRFRRMRLLLSIALLWIYVVLTGAPLSVVRAAIMFSIYLLGIIIGKSSNSYNSLYVAVLLILAISPFSVFSAGLQLSVSAVLGILAFNRMLNPISERRRILYWVVSLFTITISAVFGTMIISICYFHRLPLLFIIANIVIALSLHLLMFGGILLILTSAIGWPLTFIAQIENFIISSLNSFTEFLTQLPFAEISDIYMTTPAIIMTILLITTGAFALNMNNRRGYIALVFMFALTAPTYIFNFDNHPANDIHIVRHYSTTALFIRNNSHLDIIPTCKPQNITSVADALKNDIERYSAIYDVEEVCISHKKLITLGNTTIAIANNLPTDTVCIDYLVAGRAYSRKIDRLLEFYKPKCIIIGRDLSAKRANRLRKLCCENNLPFVDLRKEPVYLQIK